MSVEFTRGNIEIDRDIEFEFNRITAYVGVWFDPDAKFGLQTERNDQYINLYAFYDPIHNGLSMEYIIWETYTNECSDGIPYAPTPQEKNLIIEMMNEVCVREDGMSMKEQWLSFMNDFGSDETNCLLSAEEFDFLALKKGADFLLRFFGEDVLSMNTQQQVLSELEQTRLQMPSDDLCAFQKELVCWAVTTDALDSVKGMNSIGNLQSNKDKNVLALSLGARF